MSAAPLAGLQRQFLARLRGSDDAALDAEFDAALADGRMPRAIGVRVYTHAYGARLREALEHDHPVLGAYLGDALWDELCRGYLDAHPSRHRSLRHFGSDLPRYLAAVAPFRAHPEVAELAGFERRLLDSFDAADDERADWTALLARPPGDWPALRPRFHPSLGLHHAAHDSVEIWRAVKDGHPPPRAGVAIIGDWALWRDGERVSRFRSLDALESAAARHCLDGGDFAGLCDLLSASQPHDAVPMVALEYLRSWCAEGWICRWD